jgi:predicted SnoaL-like aldol condensation-catalyzing enzyme
MTRKEIALAFLQAATSGNVRDAYEKYVAHAFTHHNPYFPSDRESLLKGMEESGERFPHKKYQTVHILEDGDMVAVHGHIRLTPEMPEIAVVHLFRFEGNMIIEEWEAAQQVPEDIVNERGMF